MDENIKKLLEAVNFIHRYCIDYGCDNCPFVTQDMHCGLCDVPDVWHIPEVE